MMTDCKEKCIDHCEDFFMDRLAYLFDNATLEDCGCLHDEFVVDGQEPDEWLFINDLTNV